MPFPRPTLTQLKQRVASDITTGLEGATSLLRFSNLTIIGKVLAKAVYGLYGYLDFIALQGNPATATGVYAVAWGALRGVFVKAASAAVGVATFSGTNGTPIPTGTSLVRGDGATFTTTADATIASGGATAPIVAGTAGADGNCAAGTVFTLATGISGVSSTVTALAALTGGADVETIDAFKARYLQVYAAPPQGGAEPDYQDWAGEVPGVTRVWVRRNGMGVGTVVVYFMMDIAEAAFDGFPQGTNGVAALEDRDTPATGDQLAVANAIYPVQPVTALVYAVAPGRNVLTFTIAGLSGASAATQSAVIAAVKAAVAAGSSPGGVMLANGSTGGVTLLSTVEAAIAAIPAAAGFIVTSVTASAGTVTPGSAGNVTSNVGYLADFGSVVFA